MKVMHMLKFVCAASRRTAGVAAGVILAGGLAGVFVTPGTAYAADPIGTTTTITSATPTSTWFGTTLNVQVSVAPASGTTAPSGTVDVSGASGGCSATLSPSGSNGLSVGGCDIRHLPDGTYTLTATYEGSLPGFSQSPPSAPYPVKVGSAPMFDAYWPPLTATAGQGYSYTFHARGSGPISYTLTTSATWLHINSWNGTVWGTVPYWVKSFSYSVTASNSLGSQTVGPFTVWVKHGYVDINTYLGCPSYVLTGHKGSCTLWVTNSGSASAPNVTAQIALPWQLRADFCGSFYPWNWGCSISGNTAYENLGTLYPGQTRQLTVVFTAKTGFSLWGWHRGHPFTVKVVGFAASNGYWWFYGRSASYSIAYVTIIPHGHWW
jgi:hypothetical protein